MQGLFYFINKKQPPFEDMTFQKPVLSVSRQSGFFAFTELLRDVGQSPY